MYKKVWLNPGDVLLVELDDLLKPNECYILYKYPAGEAHSLKSKSAFNFEVKGEDESGVRFGNPDEEEEDDDEDLFEDVENAKKKEPTAIDKSVSKATRKIDKKEKDLKRSNDRYKKIMGETETTETKKINIDDI